MDNSNVVSLNKISDEIEIVRVPAHAADGPLAEVVEGVVITARCSECGPLGAPTRRAAAVAKVTLMTLDGAALMFF